MSDDDLITYQMGKAAFVKDRETGEVLAVELDERYSDWVRVFNAAECQHENKQIMRVPVAGGGIHVRECCMGCGDRFGQAMSHKDVAWVQSLPLFSEDTSTSYQSRRHLERHAFLLGLARTQYVERGKFTKFYRQYLDSPEWRAKRDLVLKRCGGICEGCGTAPATQAHHRIYQNFGNEFLFELLGLCRACHDRLHEEHPEDESFGDEDDLAIEDDGQDGGIPFDVNLDDDLRGRPPPQR